MLLAIGGIVGLLVVIAALVGAKLLQSSPTPAKRTGLAPASVVHDVSTVPASTFNTIGAVKGIGGMTRIGGTPLEQGGKPVVLYIGAEYCPFCAAERWPLAVALSHFGNWSQLGVTKSAATDIYPNTATLSFRAAQYHSSQLTLQTTELTDNAGHALQAATSLDRQLIGQYDVPPYVNSADQSGAVPFLDIGNRYILAGAQFDPQVLAGLSATQIAADLRDPSSPVAQAIDGSANVIIAAINQVLHDQASQG
jgi:thiol-disulfide isomerase/thioredoxin